jgi:SAM-dependent methyltransferase
MLNYELSKLKLHGQVLDLGSGKQTPSYYQFIPNPENFQVTLTDYYRPGRNVINLDLNQPFSLKQKYDIVMCCNVLEHVTNTDNVISESYKVLKPGGTFIGSTPFIYRYHADPADYYRFTHQAILERFSAFGFNQPKIYYLGFGPLSAAANCINDLFPRVIRPLYFLPAIYLDKFITKKGSYYYHAFPLQYLFIFTKPKK